MKLSRTPLAASLFAAASIAVTTSNSHAAVYTEVGDAGQTLATAANAGAATGFKGALSSGFDTDLYVFTVATAGSYSFSDVGGTADTTTPASVTLDTEISLFSTNGTPIVTNDDASTTNVESQFTTTLAAGTYYFGITSSGNEAINVNSQLLFKGYPSGDTTAARTAAAGVNPTTLSNFNSQSYSTDAGTYNVTINAVPEPSTWAALALGGIAAGFTFLRRRSSRA